MEEIGKDAVGMMALHEALRSVCLISSDWIYSVFWTIRLRPYKNTSLSLSLSLSLLCSSIFLSLYVIYLFVCLFLITGGSVVEMDARLVMKVAACKFSLSLLFREDGQKQSSSVFIQDMNFFFCVI